MNENMKSFLKSFKNTSGKELADILINANKENDNQMTTTLTRIFPKNDTTTHETSASKEQPLNEANRTTIQNFLFGDKNRDLFYSILKNRRSVFSPNVLLEELKYSLEDEKGLDTDTIELCCLRLLQYWKFDSDDFKNGD